MTAGWQVGAAESISRGKRALTTNRNADIGTFTNGKSCVLKLLGDLCTFAYHIGPPSLTLALDSFVASVQAPTASSADVSRTIDVQSSTNFGFSLGLGIGTSPPTYDALINDWLLVGEHAYREILGQLDSDPTATPELRAQAEYDLGFNLYQQVPH